MCDFERKLNIYFRKIHKYRLQSGGLICDKCGKHKEEIEGASAVGSVCNCVIDKGNSVTEIIYNKDFDKKLIIGLDGVEEIYKPFLKFVYGDKIFANTSENVKNRFNTPPEARKKTIEVMTNILSKSGNLKQLHILDANANIGMDSVEFCKHFDRVSSIEYYESYAKALAYNLKDFKNKTVYWGSCLDFIKDKKLCENIDVIYFDPPWGGKYYRDKTDLCGVYDDEKKLVQIDSIINKCFQDYPNIKAIFAKLPIHGSGSAIERDKIDIKITKQLKTISSKEIKFIDNYENILVKKKEEIKHSDVPIIQYTNEKGNKYSYFLYAFVRI
uniref:Methyltransferase n=1 Tax=viral metagenome TaxID=1070528 RepID=A0A6C0DZT3_9ZZZZ